MGVTFLWTASTPVSEVKCTNLRMLSVMVALVVIVHVVCVVVIKEF